MSQWHILSSVERPTNFNLLTLLSSEDREIPWRRWSLARARANTLVASSIERAACWSSCTCVIGYYSDWIEILAKTDGDATVREMKIGRSRNGCGRVDHVGVGTGGVATFSIVYTVSASVTTDK